MISYPIRGIIITYVFCTIFRHRKSPRTLITGKKLSKIQSDIVFLSRCKEFDIAKKGLRLKNPFKFQSNSLCIKGNNTCEKAERILRNTAINDACA